MTTTRAKFRCSARIANQYGPTPEHGNVSYEFTAVYDDGIPEHQRFAKATPNGKLTMTVDNPAVSFVPGELYYLDVTKAEQ
jgi:hypothetical protein